MEKKTWTVSHAKARAPQVVKGKTLEEALKKEGLDPSLWKVVQAPDEAPE